MQDGILTVQDNLKLLQKALLIHDGLCNSSFLMYWFVQKEKSLVQDKTSTSFSEGPWIE